MNYKSTVKEMKHYIKQDVHGPHRSPKTQFQSKNTFVQSNDYAITLREKKIFFKS